MLVKAELERQTEVLDALNSDNYKILSNDYILLDICSIMCYI